MISVNAVTLSFSRSTSCYSLRNYMQEHGESIEHEAMNHLKCDVCKIHSVGIEAKYVLCAARNSINPLVGHVNELFLSLSENGGLRKLV